jgi:hypothetical protein
MDEHEDAAREDMRAALADQLKQVVK